MPAPPHSGAEVVWAGYFDNYRRIYCQGQQVAAIDLSAASLTGWVYTQASVGTTWQEFILPPWCNQVTVLGSAAIYVAGSMNGAVASAESPTDGGAVGTHKMAIAAGAGYVIGIQGDPERGLVGGGGTSTPSIFVAAQASTVTATVQLERI